MKEEEWQYRNVLSDEWKTDEMAMANRRFKTFSDYEKHVKRLNAKFKSNIECRLKPANP